MPLSGPPLTICHGSRRLSYVAAYSTDGLRGSMTRSMTPILSLTNNTFSHVAPPFVVLNTPRSALSEYRWPMAATKTTSGLDGSIAMRAM